MDGMCEELMQSNVVQPRCTKQVAQFVPKPNYGALIDVLTRLYQIPDGLGETALRPEEAAAVRRCGFAARAGTTWRCPPLPDELVSWNPLLRHLSDAIDPLNRPAGWKPKRAPSRLIRQFHPVSIIERKIMAHLGKEPYYMSKRRLQQKMWRYSARFFNRTISRMIAEDTITMWQGYLFPYNREGFARCVQPAIDALEQQQSGTLHG
jgi:hypothetical protein